ncbi:MAG: cytochrome c biogenesis CcdA family protein [Chloroflexota bacterium]
MELSNIGIGFAFLAGLASFLSPCVFSLVPAYIGYLGGRSAASARCGKVNPWVPFSHGVAFVWGFSLVFISLGVATSAIGGLLYDMRTWLARIGGVVVIIFGLHMIGIFRIPFLEYDLRAQSVPDRNRGYIASLLMGVFFSAGWSPCVGPILGSILTITLSGGSISQGLVLLTAYSAGLAIPFLVASVQIGLVTTALRRYGKVMHYVEVAMGVLLVIVGAMLLTGQFEKLAQYSSSFFGIYDELALGRLLVIGLAVLAVLALIPAFIARQKGRSFLTWWLFGVTLFPVALPMALFVKRAGVSAESSSTGSVETGVSG